MLEEVLEVWLSSKGQAMKDIHSTILLRWFEFIGDEALDVTPMHILKYFSQLKKRRGIVSKFDGTESFSIASMRKELISLRAFYQFLLDNKYIKENPFADKKRTLGLTAIKPKKEYLPIPFEKIKEILDVIPTTPIGIRDRALMYILFYGGLRISEVLALRCEDVHITQNGTFYLRLLKAKGGSYIDHAITSKCWPSIEALLMQRGLDGGPLKSPLFTGYRYNKCQNNFMCRKWAYKSFKKYCALVGLEGYSPHCARVTGITKLLSDGVTYKEVQNFSRHASIQMVEHYDRRFFSIDKSPNLKLDY